MPPYSGNTPSRGNTTGPKGPGSTNNGNGGGYKDLADSLHAAGLSGVGDTSKAPGNQPGPTGGGVSGGKSGFKGIGSNPPAPPGSVPNTARHGSFGANAPAESVAPPEADITTHQKMLDYQDKSFLDHVKGFFGFHEINPYSQNSSYDDFAGEEASDPTAEVNFDILKAPVIGIGLSLIPGVGPFLGAAYNLASGIYQGNPVQAVLGAIPVVGSLLGPAASTITSGIGAVGNIAGAGANLAGYNGIDDMLGTDNLFDGIGSGTGSGDNTGFSSVGAGAGAGTNGSRDGRKGFSSISSSLAANDNKTTTASSSGSGTSQTAVSPQQQSSIRSAYGMVSGVGDGEGDGGMEPKASQGFGGRANAMKRSSYSYK